MTSSAKLRDPALSVGSHPDPTVWILLGNQTGDDNQLRALAEELGWPFEAKPLSYNSLKHFAFLRNERLLHLTDDARALIAPPWPDVVMGVSYQSISVARYIRRQSGGRARIVQLGNPRTDLRDIDLVVATPQYPLPAASNLLRIPFPVGNPARAVGATEDEVRWLDSMPRPRRLIAVGGSTRRWRIDLDQLKRSIRHLQKEREKSGGSIIAVISRRTPPTVVRGLEALLGTALDACVQSFPRFAVLLSNCDECHVTGDSVSMLAEAILTGKPVGMIPVRRSVQGVVSDLLRQAGVRLPAKTDLTAFWSYLTSEKLVGPVSAPVASAAVETTQVAADAVRSIFAMPREPKIWALLGAHKGDNNQVVALAEAMGLPFETKQLIYNRWRHLGPRALGATFRSLTRSSRKILSAEIPDVTISSGHRSVAAVQFLRKRSGGKTRSIHVGYPRVSPGKFDLVVATPEYPIRDHPNLLRIPFALTRNGHGDAPEDPFWESYPAPRRLLVLGGPTLYWRLGLRSALNALDPLLDAACVEGGSVIVVGSPRTPQRLLDQVDRRILDADAPAVLVGPGGTPAYAELLSKADSIAVTADSVAMVSEALVTGKPVTLVPVTATHAGRVLIGLMDRLRPGKRMIPRDLRAFWRVLDRHGFVRSADTHGKVEVPNVNGLAASRSLAVFEGASPLATGTGAERQ